MLVDTSKKSQKMNKNFDTWAARRPFALSDSMRNTFSAQKNEHATADFLKRLYKVAYVQDTSSGNHTAG